MSGKHREALLRVLILVAIVNFVIFVFVALNIGGDAINGTAVDGHYFLSSKGRLTDVSQLLFEYSAWHARSVMLTCIAGVAAGLLLKRKNGDQ